MGRVILNPPLDLDLVHPAPGPHNVVMVEGSGDPFRVVFVCTGNICRSPMADVVFRCFAEKAGLADRVESSSAGTGEWHVGERADPRTIDALARRGYEGTHHRARMFSYDDFVRNDLVIGMDRTHQRYLTGWARTPGDADKIDLLLPFDPVANGRVDVPDPYYGDAGMFDDVLVMIESACRALFRQLEPAVRLAV